MLEAVPLSTRTLHTQKQVFRKLFFSQGKKKHININKFAGLSRDWVGCQKFVYVFFRVIPYGGEKTHKQNSPQNPRDNPVKILCKCFVLYVFFFRSLFSPGYNYNYIANSREIVFACASVSHGKAASITITEAKA